jgi:hypothetical protein
LLTACNGGDGTADVALTADTLDTHFVAQAVLACPEGDQPCSPPTSSSTADFVNLVLDTLDGIQPRAIRFNEPGIVYELGMQLGQETVLHDGVPQETIVNQGSSASYAMATPEILIQPGEVVYDGTVFPYHSTPPSGEPDFETRHYCVSFPDNCVILTIPHANDLLLPASQVIGVHRYQSETSGALPALVSNEYHWRGTLGSLTDRTDIVATGSEAIRYSGFLQIHGGDGSPVSESIQSHFGTASCPVSFSVDPVTRSVDGAEIQCDYVDPDTNHRVTFSLAGEHFTLNESRLERGLPLVPITYSVELHANNLLSAPLFSYTDQVNALSGAILGQQGYVAVLQGQGGQSVFEIIAVRDPTAGALPPVEAN